MVVVRRGIIIQRCRRTRNTLNVQRLSHACILQLWQSVDNCRSPCAHREKAVRRRNTNSGGDGRDGYANAVINRVNRTSRELRVPDHYRAAVRQFFFFPFFCKHGRVRRDAVYGIRPAIPCQPRKSPDHNWLAHSGVCGAGPCF